ncbi:hypothetical protein P344_02325 [Spiroplasma mirum ATCC 29335]|uniref:ABC transporter domain-containing protein n=1 Tax=Spiroplasma mirum ATCC 29335 TaxID=838561 RepID=W0GQK8_9MOLU|nr:MULTISPECIES: ABC transporter ATP-binding protein/permease [Spiroplasma]AHF60831.1 putative ABC-type transport system ATP-binding protein [Spiroplasma mirum ATCC 29335]AHI57812.1 hypothetical protein P344_02325 [Spiroplasma mirum ATCC 29335]AKM52944.1 ABC transporter ATP-binding protein [Spiroplasma atrichopogonis]
MDTIKENKKRIDVHKPLVELKNVYKQYKNKMALNGVNLVINPGDQIGVIGANGSGKSTMSEIIGGIRKPTKGEVIKQENLTIGLQFQDSKYPIGISVIDMIKYYLHTFNIKMAENKLRELLKTYQILGMENKFIECLSGGQQQRLNILLAVIHDPDLVILDEVSTGLDIEVRAEIFQFLKENIVDKGKAMFLVTHMMSEVEDFCEKYIYVHNGEIKDSGNVKDIVAKYGSVHAYTWKMFELNKKADLQKQYEGDTKKAADKQAKVKKQKPSLVDKWISDGSNYGKNRPLILLMIKYYYKGFFVPFFLFAFPIVILFLEGFAFKGQVTPGNNPVHTLVGSIAVTQTMSVGIFIIPQTILEFKNSVLMKRIGATNIKPVFFVLAVIAVGFAFIILAFFWTLLWAGIFFGGSFGWDKVAIPYNVGPAIPFALIIFVSSIGLGLMLASVFKSTTAFVAVSNVIYMPIAFLSGSFMPAELILNSNVLKYVTYINPFKYCLDPFLAAWKGNFSFTTTFAIYLAVSLGLLATYIGVASWKMRWQA